MNGKRTIKFSIWIAIAVFLALAFPRVSDAQQSVCKQQGSRQVSLRASAAISATANGTVIGSLQDCREAMFILDVTVASAGVDATGALNVYVQTSPDGTNYTDVVAFALISASTAQRIARWTSRTDPTTAEGALQAGALSAGTVQDGPAGRLWRVRSVVSGTVGSWTMSVGGYFRD